MPPENQSTQNSEKKVLSISMRNSRNGSMGRTPTAPRRLAPRRLLRRPLRLPAEVPVEVACLHPLCQQHLVVGLARPRALLRRRYLVARHHLHLVSHKHLRLDLHGLSLPALFRLLEVPHLDQEALLDPPGLPLR